MLKWTVEFQVSDNWVADGFDVTKESAKDIIEKALPYSYSYETKAKVLSKPDAKIIRKLQGYSD